MKVGLRGDDDTFGKVGTIIRLNTAPGSSRRYDKAFVRWHNGQEEWIETSRLEKQP